MSFPGVRQRALAVQFFKFGVIGGIGFIFDNALVYLGIYALDMSRVEAGLFSFPFIVTFTWFGNRIFTFREASRTSAARQWMRFASVCAIGLVFNRGTYILLVSTVPLAYAHPVFGLLAGTAAGMFFNFFAARKIVFK